MSAVAAFASCSKAARFRGHSPVGRVSHTVRNSSICFTVALASWIAGIPTAASSNNSSRWCSGFRGSAEGSEHQRMPERFVRRHDRPSPRRRELLHPAQLALEHPQVGLHLVGVIGVEPDWEGLRFGCGAGGGVVDDTPRRLSPSLRLNQRGEHLSYCSPTDSTVPVLRREMARFLAAPSSSHPKSPIRKSLAVWQNARRSDSMGIRGVGDSARRQGAPEWAVEPWCTDVQCYDASRRWP